MLPMCTVIPVVLVLSSSEQAEAAGGQELAGHHGVGQRESRVAGVQVLLADDVQLLVQTSEGVDQMLHVGRAGWRTDREPARDGLTEGPVLLVRLTGEVHVERLDVHVGDALGVLLDHLDRVATTVDDVAGVQAQVDVRRVGRLEDPVDVLRGLDVAVAVRVQHHLQAVLVLEDLAELVGVLDVQVPGVRREHAVVGERPGLLVPEHRGQVHDVLRADRVLSPDAWNLYVENANKLGQILKDEYGLKMVLHPHGDSHIETPEDIDRIFEATDPTYVNLCLDTGHIVYGGGDPIEMIKKYPERISYVHIKAFDVDLTRESHEKDWPFGEAVARGLSVRPPAGAPDMKDLVDALAGLDKELYVICEQDLYPCDPRLPLPNAVMTRQFLAACGLGLL